MIDVTTIDREYLDQLSVEQLRDLARQLTEQSQRASREIQWRDAKIDKLTFELAQLKRVQFGVKSERLNAEQRALFDEAVAADIAALEEQLEQLTRKPADADDGEKKKPKRAPLPPELPRVDRHHEPNNTNCSCGCQMKRIGEEVSEKLDYTPGVFTVERHIRGKWACGDCRTLVQAPVPAAVIDKGIPTAGLLAHVLVAKHADHLPLYRQEAIFARAGLAIPRSTLGAWIGQCGVRLQPVVDALKEHLLRCQVLHADETPVAMLDPGSGKTHRAYLWAYAAAQSEQLKAVVYDFTRTRAGENARVFLGHSGPDQPQRRPWTGSLVCDDYSGYCALFELGVTEAGCMAHARRKFIQLYESNKSSVAEAAVDLIAKLYEVERELHGKDLEEVLQQRRSRSAPLAKTLHEWLIAHRAKVPNGSATARAIDYSLNRWSALTRYLHDPRLPIDNNHDERQIRPWATGRKNWLFAGTLAAGQRAAAITSLIQSAKLNGHDPYAYLKDVLERLPTQRASAVDELMPHVWQRRAS
ncbi:IS66 family transposase [Ramlibacter sp. RBP-2]|uniref:IS66 family transposase n=1 Tax=Ramlibacter lithotrophicus TaxID=2606681 RepID=A0A7X6DL08_9BURK|nr:IS66 family transposase [Ramlibacter lithotrophicus]NKE69125.1 IS66 family transposase [Ramlibacter lithotrophicus]